MSERFAGKMSLTTNTVGSEDLKSAKGQPAEIKKKFWSKSEKRGRLGLKYKMKWVHVCEKKDERGLWKVLNVEGEVFDEQIVVNFKKGNLS